MKKILIVGAGSYVGDSFKKYCENHYKNEFAVDILDARGLKPKQQRFKGYDAVFYVAGIVHMKETKSNTRLYYSVNRDLAVKVAKTAKNASVGQIVVMSTMAVYGMGTGMITKHTKPVPVSHYGKSKLQADRIIWKMRSENFRVAVLRPPMIYGKGCKGNYQKLRILALHIPVFPKVGNQRSMSYIGNLCEFVAEVVGERKQGLFFPQNVEYVNTTEMINAIRSAHGKKTIRLPGFNWISKMSVNALAKAFGSLTYEPVDGLDKYRFEESILLTEK